MEMPQQDHTGYATLFLLGLVITWKTIIQVGLNQISPQYPLNSPKRMAAAANVAAGKACVSSHTVMKAIGTSEAPIIVQPWTVTVHNRQPYIW